MRIAAIADVHCGIHSGEEVRRLLQGVAGEADLLVLAGDLTNMGLPEEMEVLLTELRRIALPMVAVAGNHDHESDQLEALIELMKRDGIHVLDGSVHVVKGLGFIGTKGFCGGFDTLAVQPFGERALKQFIRVSIDEAKRLERELAELSASRKVAVLHYSPIKETLVGEAPELYPFLGSSLLARAIDRHGVDLILHGHAHNGSPEGRTARGIPVHNVCRFVQMRSFNRPYAILEV